MAIFSKVKPKPVFKKSRYKCPFYGFAKTIDGFRDGGRNRCGLIVKGDFPCEMEKEEKVPDWNQCSFNNEDNKAAIKEIAALNVFPREFRPPSQLGKGMSFKKWLKYIMSQTG